MIVTRKMLANKLIKRLEENIFADVVEKLQSLTVS